MNRKLLVDVPVTIHSAVEGQPDFTFVLPAGTVVRDTLGRVGDKAEIQWGTAGQQRRSRLYANIPEAFLGPVDGQSLEDLWAGRPCES